MYVSEGLQGNGGGFVDYFSQLSVSFMAWWAWDKYTSASFFAKQVFFRTKPKNDLAENRPDHPAEFRFIPVRHAGEVRPVDLVLLRGRLQLEQGVAGRPHHGHARVRH